jgi:hypothetical protein
MPRLFALPGSRFNYMNHWQVTARRSGPVKDGFVSGT